MYRAPARFPEDFVFQCTAAERNELVIKCDRLTKLKHSAVMSYVFTESGFAMLSGVLNSEQAVLINVQIVGAFIRLRRMRIDHEAIRLSIEGLERRVGKNERDIQMEIKAIQSILTPPDPPKKTFRIGFCPPEKKGYLAILTPGDRTGDSLRRCADDRYTKPSPRHRQ